MNNAVKKRQKIVKAARKCFMRYGVDKTNMADIAKESEMARTAIYRIFSTRQELFDEAVFARFDEIARLIEADIAKADSLADAFFRGTVSAIHLARDDRELQNLFSTSSSRHEYRLVADDSPIAQGIMLQIWKPIFDQARKANVMRLDVSDDDVIEWMRGTYLFLLLRNNLSIEHEKYLIKKFLMVSLLTTEAVDEWNRSHEDFNA